MANMLPRGMSGPQVSSPFAEKAKPISPAKANPFAKALQHHKAMGVALNNKNAKLAMHHAGHMMLALKGSGTSSPSSMTEPDGATLESPVDEEAPATASAPAPSLPSAPPISAPKSPGAPSMPKAPGKPGMSAMFAKMRGGMK